jgi:CHAP domain-containing protein
MPTDPYTYPAPWLDASVDPTRAAIARWALLRVGVYELPPGSNRSGLIDQWNEAAGAPAGSPWCASFASAAWRENGVSPLGDASCEDWHRQAKLANRWLATPGIGDIALFCFAGNGLADHAGVVVRIEPTILSVEGNTSETGSREGVGAFLKDRDGKLLLGYVSLARP